MELLIDLLALAFFFIFLMAFIIACYAVTLFCLAVIVVGMRLLFNGFRRGYRAVKNFFADRISAANHRYEIWSVERDLAKSHKRTIPVDEFVESLA